MPFCLGRAGKEGGSCAATGIGRRARREGGDGMCGSGKARDCGRAAAGEWERGSLGREITESGEDEERAAFSRRSAGISCRRKAETTWPASCSRASLFDIVELSTYCEARCTTTGLSLFRELVSGGSAVFTMSRQKKTAPPANRTTRSRGRGAKSRKHETPDTYDPGLGTGALQARRFGARPLGKNNGGVIVPSSIFGKKEDTPKSLLR